MVAALTVFAGSSAAVGRAAVKVKGSHRLAE
jgi:hypothetical protein